MAGRAEHQADPGPLFAMLQLDGVMVFLPQSDVRTVEPALDIASTDGAPGIGEITVGGRSWPVHCLTGELAPARSVPPTRHICALLDAGDESFALLCDDFKPLHARELAFHPLPDCMGGEQGCAHSLAVYEERVGCVVSAAGLKALIDADAAGPGPDVPAARAGAGER